MKTQKTLRAVLATLLLIVIVAMSIPSFAANPEVGSITLNNVENGSKITVYQLATFNYDYDKGQPIYPTYKWNEEVNTWLESSAYSTYAGAAGAEKFEKAGQDTVDAVYGAITAAIKTPDALSVTAFKTIENAADATVAINELPIGTYLIVVENANRIYQPIVRNIGMDHNGTAWEVADANVSVDTKSTKLTIEKTTTNDSYKTSEEIVYDIKSDVPTYPASAKSKVYRIADKLPAEMTADTTSIEVYGLTAEDLKTPEATGTKLTAGEDYTLNTTATEKYTFRVEFDDYSKISGFAKIHVSYKAKINAGTELNKALTNEAYLEYSNNPYDENNSTEGTGDTEKTEETVKTYGFVVNKVDGTVAGEDKPALPGAVFTVYSDESKATKLGFTETSVGSGIYYYDKDSTVYELNVNNEGHLEVRGLDAGTYYLEEVKAPSGFNKLSEVKTIVIAENEAAKAYTIENNKGFKLPLTGGMGTVVFTAAGVVLIVVGAALLITINKKKNAKN